MPERVFKKAGIMAETKKRGRAIFFSAAAVLVVIAVITGLALHFGRPRFLRGERGRVSPVLKPFDLNDRNFFLVDNRYLLRLDSTQSSLRWAFSRPVRGQLHIAFFAFPKGGPVPPLRFFAAAVSSRGRQKTVIFETWRNESADVIERHYEVAVSLPAGSEIEFAAVPETADDWSSVDVGITVPRVETEKTIPPPSHLLIISIDALRSDFLGVYQALAGRPPQQSFSPELDRFAENAVVFLNARTVQSATWPALSSMALSEYPRVHKVTRNREFLKTAGDSIATLMRGRGYATVELAANGESLNIPGFEEKRKFALDAGLIAFARKKIAEQSAAPFFHRYHLWGVHDQYAPPEWVMKILEKGNPDYRYKLYSTNDMMLGKAPSGPAEVAAVRRLYAGAVFYVDSLLKSLFDDLSRRGLWDEMMIIVTADHGEELYDHNSYFYHNPSLYDSAIKIPLLIKFPHQRRQRVVKENVSLIDILPTVYHYFIGPPAPGLFSGISLLELLSGRRGPFRERILFVETEDSQIIAAIEDHYKLMYNPLGLLPLNRLGLPFLIKKVEFYDLQSDPGEIRNLSDSDSPVLRRLLLAADRFLHTEQQPGAKVGRGKVELTEEQRREAEERLRSLGYIR
jgi:arylsulfatase A-like enzyme